MNLLTGKGWSGGGAGNVLPGKLWSNLEVVTYWAHLPRSHSA